jgi:hypothetical protein
VTAPEQEKADRPWVRPLAYAAALLVLAGAAGFGAGYLARGGDSGPDLSQEEAFAEARERTEAEVSREMARQGFIDGKRSGRSHGIIAGGMAAESAVTIVVRDQAASEAQSAAASAQSELAGMTSAPPPPTPEVEDGG